MAAFETDTAVVSTNAGRYRGANSPGADGEVEIEVETVKRGRSLYTATAPLAQGGRTRVPVDGPLEEDCELWNTAGHLVAMSRQLARALPPSP